eukprot:Plantae.Rhodophyta-Purpureofilum_apyrenoidigerum.ctg5182.p1 GENE.Plantae.Rhodophyta-Purpureofilum_apyrenoidigerum.ctg5182~~Plantae.Rhodophyta-Purpureofilum_apyrenoidigerum.ctg5182.p1  ORF type:complete len:343 (-),score=50.69 Plantae.Rhodophyta-Purpureofilum_apyrenoidigerum.ctg5182:520-1548(-)
MMPADERRNIVHVGAVSEKLVSMEKVPIVYSAIYNVKFFGIEKLHPFDSCKYEKIAVAISDGRELVPVDRAVTDEELATVHTDNYLESLRSSRRIAQICELPPLAVMPLFLIQKHVLTPMRWQVRGTVLAGELAMQHGWSINLGGGMHHAGPEDASGWCVYADIFLCIVNLRKKNLVRLIMIVDLDVHQGNGLARSKLDLEEPDSVYILDFYNPAIFPQDRRAKEGINQQWHVSRGTVDEAYLEALEAALKSSFEQFTPDIVLYNAGTDILQGDPLNGGVSVTPVGVTRRDALLFKACFDRHIPVCMVLSGGYSSQSASTVSLSVENLLRNVVPMMSFPGPR